MARTDTVGSIYLLHFDRPFKHAEHYLGWAIDHEARVREHLDGRGSPLVKAALASGIAVKLVKVWKKKTRNDERKIKNGGTLKRVCPLCVAGYRKRKAAGMKKVRAKRADKDNGSKQIEVTSQTNQVPEPAG